MKPLSALVRPPGPIVAAMILCGLFSLGCRSAAAPTAEHGHAPAPPPAAPDQNPVRHEMLLLTAALSNALAGIGRGDVTGIRHDLHRVHTAKDATGAAIAGGGYRPPRGADRIERFVELDEAFHEHLARMVAASQRNDVPAAAAALAAAVADCHGCHAEFRDAPPTEAAPH